MEDYSQSGEQPHILRIVQSISNGRVLDIGAWNPIDKSNSRALIEMGWSAVLVEPSPGPLRGLVREYGQWNMVTVIGAAVAVEEGLIELAITDDAVSCDPASAGYQTWKQAGGFFGKVLVPAISVKNLFERFGGDFSVVSIDTEGTSFNIFQAMIAMGPRPKCIVVEHDNRHQEFAAVYQAAGYRQAFLNENNMVLELV